MPPYILIETGSADADPKANAAFLHGYDASIRAVDIGVAINGSDRHYGRLDRSPQSFR
ncbi:hypothetical protein D3C71_2195420 [compost metagenome]